MDMRLNGNWRIQTTSLANNNWHYLTYTYNDDTNTGELYEGGTRVDYTTSVTEGWLNPERLIGIQNANNRAPDGILDEMRISDTIYSQAWINASYLNQFSPDDFYTLGNEQEQTSLTISIAYPQEAVYNYPVTELNYTITNGTELDKCWWTNDSGATNNTINCNQNVTGISSQEGENTWRVYVNNTQGTANYDEVTFTIDTANPEITIEIPENKSYPSSTIEFNISGNENLSYCKFTLNNWQDNQTMTAYNSTYFNYTNSSVGEGEFTAKFWCNDTAGNINNTETIDFSTDTTFPLIDYGEGTEANDSNFSRNWIFVNASVQEQNPFNITFTLHNLTGLVNITTFFMQEEESNTTINFTSLEGGSYFYNVTIRDKAGNSNYTETRKINLDYTPPVLYIDFPENLTYPSNITELNYTAQDTNLEACWWTNDSGATNYTITCGENVTGQNASDGDHIWTIYANDSFGNTGNSSVIFNVDTDIPEIIIYYPQNKTYSYNLTEINYSVSDKDLEACWWTNDSGTNNYTIDCGQNITDINSSEGLNFWIIYANDSVGHLGKEEIEFTVDTTPPGIKINSPENQSYRPYSVDFNISSSEDIDFCKFTLNNWNTNYTMTDYNSTYFNYTNSSISEGEFTAKFWCNDSYGNVNKTETRDFTVYFPEVKLDVLYPTENIVVGHYQVFNVTLNVTCLKTDCGEINITLDPKTWLDDEWEYRKNHTIQGTAAGAQTNYVMQVIVHNGSGTDSGKNIYCDGKCKSDFGDIRFTSSDGLTELDYFLEEYNSGKNASFWVEIDSIPASPGSTSINIYYGNSGASTTSDPENTFLFFEGFEGSHSLTSGSGSVNIESGGISGSYQGDIDGGGSYAVVYDSASSFSRTGHFYEAYVKYTESDTIPVGIHFLGQNTGEQGYQMIIDDRDSGSTPSLRKDTDYGSSVTGSYSAGADNWIFFRAYADSSSFYGQVYEDAFTESTASTAQFSDSSYSSGSVGGFAYQDGGGKMDNLRVRKRASPEPSHGSWSEEEGYVPEKNIINTTEGAEPFYTNASNNPLTTSYLNQGESEIIVFYVNATFSRGTYEFFAYANITYNMDLWNITEKWNVSIDSAPPELSDLETDKEYTCGTSETVRVTCTAVDLLLNISSVLIEATHSLSGSQNYSAQELSGDTYYSDITLDELGDWSFKCIANDSLDNLGVLSSNEIVTTYSDLPDLEIKTSGITFSNLNPIEYEGVIVNATIYNTQCGNADGFSVGFYNQDPDSGGRQINGNQTVSLAGFENITINITWSAEIGNNNIFVEADFNNSFSEFNESNNKANKTITVESWQDFYGYANVTKILGDISANNISLWSNETNLAGNIYVTDSEAIVEWASLQALGRDDGGAGTSNDFNDIDNLLNMSNFNDSVSSIYTSDGSTPISTDSFLIRQVKINNVPVVNSTNTTNFITGILWDTSDDDTDGEFSQDDEEDLVFAAKINKNLDGSYGNYDYEISIPVRLREYDSTDSSELYLYYELN
jgi:hypothetical protein